MGRVGEVGRMSFPEKSSLSAFKSVTAGLFIFLKKPSPRKRSRSPSPRKKAPFSPSRGLQRLCCRAWRRSPCRSACLMQEWSPVNPAGRGLCHRWGGANLWCFSAPPLPQDSGSFWAKFLCAQPQPSSHLQAEEWGGESHDVSCLGVCLTWKAGGHKCAGQPGTSPCLSESCPRAGPAVLASGALVVWGFYYYYFLILGLYSALASCQGGRMLCVISGER